MSKRVLLGNKPSGVLAPSKKLISSVQADKSRPKKVESDSETEFQKFKRYIDEEDDEDQSDGL